VLIGFFGGLAIAVSLGVAIAESKFFKVMVYPYIHRFQRRAARRLRAIVPDSGSASASGRRSPWVIAGRRLSHDGQHYRRHGRNRPADGKS